MTHRGESVNIRRTDTDRGESVNIRQTEVRMIDCKQTERGENVNIGQRARASAELGEVKVQLWR